MVVQKRISYFTSASDKHFRLQNDWLKLVLLLASPPTEHSELNTQTWNNESRDFSCMPSIIGIHYYKGQIILLFMPAIIAYVWTQPGLNSQSNVNCIKLQNFSSTGLPNMPGLCRTAPTKQAFIMGVPKARVSGACLAMAAPASKLPDC